MIKPSHFKHFSLSRSSDDQVNDSFMSLPVSSVFVKDCIVEETELTVDGEQVGALALLDIGWRAR
jgi:hypothetical protein